MNNKILPVSVLALTISIYGGAQAATVNPGEGEYEFSGPLAISQSIFSFDCHMDLTVDISQDGNLVVFNVIDGAISGGSICGTFSMVFPWVAVVNTSPLGDGENIPLNLEIHNVDISGYVGQCGSGDDVLPAVFEFVNPSSFPSKIGMLAGLGNCGFKADLEEVGGSLRISNP